MVTAIERFVEQRPRHRGSIALLLTSDEEGPAVDGVRRVTEVLAKRGERIDWCLVGEPSSTDRLGDVVKNGRRGSLSGRIVVQGIQGHVAYPHLARNPVHDLARLLSKLADTVWTKAARTSRRRASRCRTSLPARERTTSSPDRAEAAFNFRYSTCHDRDSIVAAVESAAKALDLDYRIDWRHSGKPFLTEPGRLIEAGRRRGGIRGRLPPRTLHRRGTSDGRFIAPTGAEVVELGPVNATIHSIDERVLAADLDRLSEMYEGVIDRLLGTEPAPDSGRGDRRALRATARPRRIRSRQKRPKGLGSPARSHQKTRPPLRGRAGARACYLLIRP